MRLSKTLRFIQIGIIILILLFLNPFGIPLLFSLIIALILITCAVVDFIHSIYLRFKKAYKMDKQKLLIDFISLVLGVIVLYIDLLLLIFQGVKMSN